MNKRKRNTRGNVRNTRARFGLSPRSSSSIGLRVPFYRGPIRTPAERGNIRTRQISLQLIGTVVTSAGGLNADVYGSNPAGGTGWASLAAVYDEFRVLGMELRYVPTARYNRPVGVAEVPMAVVIDHDNATALASYHGVVPAADAYESVTLQGIEDPWTRVARLSDFNEATYQNTNAPASTFYIKTFYQSGTAAAAELGRFLLVWKIEFRGRGV